MGSGKYMYNNNKKELIINLTNIKENKNLDKNYIKYYIDFFIDGILPQKKYDSIIRGKYNQNTGNIIIHKFMEKYVYAWNNESNYINTKYKAGAIVIDIDSFKDFNFKSLNIS